jgi:hypothetical protein
MLGNNKLAPEVGCTPARRSPAGEASPLNSWQTVDVVVDGDAKGAEDDQGGRDDLLAATKSDICSTN